MDLHCTMLSSPHPPPSTQLPKLGCHETMLRLTTCPECYEETRNIADKENAYKGLNGANCRADVTVKHSFGAAIVLGAIKKQNIQSVS